MKNNRPLSPHITIHKWIFSQIMSIMHRATAIGFSLGLLFISLWLLSFSLGLIYYSIFELFFFNFVGKVIILIISFCFIFYFIDELRKFFWVFSLGIDVRTIKITSCLVIFFSLFFLFFIILYLL